MDFLSPVLGAVTGIEAAMWKDILLFALKVILFALPFILIGLFLENDFQKVPVVRRLTKSFLVFLFVGPVIFFGILNFLAPEMPETFWESYPLLENFWLMEGRLAPLVLSGAALVYFLLYVLETVRGDLTN